MLRRVRENLRLFDTTGLSPELVRSLYLVILAVTFGQVCFVVTDGPALTGFVRMLGAGDFVYSVLMAIPFVGGAMQLFASFVTERTRARRSYMLVFGVIQRMMWLPVALTPFIFPDRMQNLRLWAVVVFIAVSSCSGAFVNVCFMSLVGDLVPMRLRGRYFSVRSRVSIIVAVIASLLVSLALDASSGYTGYLVVFTVAAVFGTLDILTFLFVPWPPMPEKSAKESPVGMLKELWSQKRFVKLVLFWTMWYFVVRLPGPFYTVFMLDVLKMSYFQISLLNNTMSMVFTALVITFWGRLMDSHGYKPVIKIAGVFAAGIPLAWTLMNERNVWLVGVCQAIAGAVWCAVDLSAQNTYLNAAPAKNRTLYVAAYSVCTQIAGNALAYVAGGFVIDRVFAVFDGITVPVFTIDRYTAMFILSALLRFVVLFGAIGLIEEPDAKSARTTLRDLADACRARARVAAYSFKRLVQRRGV